MDDNISEKQLRDIFDQSIISFVFDGYHKRNTPTTVFLGAQPAAGKTAGQRHILDMYPDHSIVPIVGDDFRHFHPDYLKIMRENPIAMPDVTAYAAGRWTGMCVEYADTNGYSSIIEGTWRNERTVLDEATRAKELGRKCHAVVIAVPPAMSRIGFLNRYYSALTDDGSARWTPPVAHERTIDNISNTIGEICTSGLFDRYTSLKRNGSVLYDGNDAASWHDAWSDEFRRDLTDEEMSALEQNVSAILVASDKHTPELTNTVKSICNAALSGCCDAMVWVDGYVRADGTKVSGYMRRAPHRRS